MARRFLTTLRSNAIALVAVLIAMSGTAAAAGFVVSRNAQVGPGTISGHAPPPGDHANLITGSVDSRDLADGSVRPVDLAPLPVWQGTGSLFSVFGCDQSPHFWQDFGFGYQPFGFRKDAAGVVHLRGALGCPTVVTQPQSESIFRLKPPFCPTAKEVFPVVTGNGGGTFAMSDVEVDAVAPQDNNCEVFLGPGAVTGFVSFSGIEFDTRG